MMTVPPITDDPEEVYRLTGYRRPSYQSRWLTQHGIRHHRNGLGRVVIVWGTAEQPKREASLGRVR